jgi:hypothetical protein
MPPISLGQAQLSKLWARCVRPPPRPRHGWDASLPPPHALRLLLTPPMSRPSQRPGNLPSCINSSQLGVPPCPHLPARPNPPTCTAPLAPPIPPSRVMTVDRDPTAASQAPPTYPTRPPGADASKAPPPARPHPTRHRSARPPACSFHSSWANPTDGPHPASARPAPSPMRPSTPRPPADHLGPLKGRNAVPPRLRPSRPTFPNLPPYPQPRNERSSQTHVMPAPLAA